MDQKEDVERLAYKLWVERGSPSGTPHEDWLKAEEMIIKGITVAHIAPGPPIGGPNEQPDNNLGPTVAEVARATVAEQAVAEAGNRPDVAASRGNDPQQRAMPPTRRTPPEAPQQSQQEIDRHFQERRAATGKAQPTAPPSREPEQHQEVDRELGKAQQRMTHEHREQERREQERREQPKD